METQPSASVSALYPTLDSKSCSDSRLSTPVLILPQPLAALQGRRSSPTAFVRPLGREGLPKFLSRCSELPNRKS